MTENSKKLISLIVPVYNEVDNVRALYDAVTRVMAGLEDRYDWELLFTDNHSEDGTFAILEEIAAADGRVRAIRFSRNFGFQRSILTGYMNARGEAAIQLDCDLQDPPELIPEFIAKWEEGYQVVYGVRRSRQEGAIITGLRKIFYRLIDALTEDKLPHDAGDFRLVGRPVLDALQGLDDQHPYLRGMIATLGFRQVGVPYDRNRRERGESKFSFGQLVSLALDGILHHSVIPLRIATMIGLIMAVLTFFGIIVYGSRRLFFGQDWPPGFATTTLLLLLSITLNALFLGVIGEYLGRIYQQVKKGPVTVEERRLNFDDD